MNSESFKRIGNYDPSMEEEIQADLPEDMKSVTARVDTTSTEDWIRALIFDLRSAVNEIVASYPDFYSQFIGNLSAQLRTKTQEIVDESLIRFELRSNLTRESAQEMVLSDRYPISIRTKMLEHFDARKYDLIAELALSHDGAERTRPNKGKVGPDCPMEVGEELQHMDWEKFRESVTSED